MKMSFTRSPSLLVALVALFVALGGTSYAALTLGKNSVGSAQLKPGAVTSAKVKNGAITGSKIAQHAVTASKLNLSGVTVPNASKLGGEPLASFVTGGGQVFSGHATVASTIGTEIASIPRLGELSGVVDAGDTALIGFELGNGTNQTGQTVDETAFQSGNVTDQEVGEIAAGDDWLGRFGSIGDSFESPSEYVVQFAWGTGATAHSVTLTLSDFETSAGQFQVLVQGMAQ